jgi:hypothetical protein
MGSSLIRGTETAVDGSPTPLRRVLRAIGMVRYRFFLYAGLLPYLLGAVWAHSVAGHLDAPMFWSGFCGVVLAVVGVEAFNEYFELHSLRLGRRAAAER